MTYFRKDAVLLARDLAALHGLPDAVVAALHEPALELDGVAEEAVVLDLAGAVLLAGAGGEGLELGVELGVAALGEVQEEVEAGDAVALAGGGGRRGEELVVRLQLRHVPREGFGVPRPDAEERALLVHVPREGQVLRRRSRDRRRGFQGQERDLGLLELRVGFRVRQARIRAQLVEDLLEGLFGHVGGGGWLCWCWSRYRRR